MIKYSLRWGGFHGGGEYSSHRSLKAAMKSAACHARECACGLGGVVVEGTAAELAAIGAYETTAGIVVVQLPDGTFECAED